MSGAETLVIRPDRALRFFARDGGQGLAAGASGTLQMVEGAEAIRQSLMTLLSTRPGERVMRPDYGCDLEALTFASGGPTMEMLAALLIRRAIERFEPRVGDIRVTASPDPEDPARLFIAVDYTIRRQQRRDRIGLVVPTLETNEAV
ncbi:MAG: GPW/gp25 family protein [Pseudomonadota bacterium]